MSISRKSTIIACIPSLVMLASFFSLVIHMRMSLGGWPDSIDENGFPPPLRVHAFATLAIFGVLLLSTVYLGPVAIASLLVVRKWRQWAPYAALHCLLFFVSWGLMHVAPDGFLYWWRD